jgi:hypothetical protein
MVVAILGPGEKGRERMAAEDQVSGEVSLASGASASTVLYRVLADVAAAYPSVFADVDLGGSADAFKGRYPNVLPVFEAHRADSADRVEIAHALVDSMASRMAWRSDDGEIPLAAHVSRPAMPLALETRSFASTPNLRPKVPVAGSLLSGNALLDYAGSQVDCGSASPGVVEGTAWVVKNAGDAGFNLSDRRIVVLGAAAELAPTRMWLEGGADVLWIDTTPLPADLLQASDLAGTVRWVPGGADLLAEPGRIRSTIEEFAGDGRVDIGLYAYAPGKARELRLTTVMQAIVDALPRDCVGTIAMLVSPTTCGVLSEHDLAGEERRNAQRPRWQRALGSVGLLGKGGGHAEAGSTATNRGVVSIQGTSYQAAQYLGKLMAAEAWAAGPDAHHVSANTAGISRTESLQHPLFDAAFAGADAFGVETYDPATTAALNGLLVLRDWLDPDAPCRPDPDPDRTGADLACALTTTRIHGGVYQAPYPVDQALRIAAGIGIAKDPRRITPIIRNRPA